MSKLSAYLADALINAVLRNTAYTSPSTVYLSLHTADPGDTGTSEVSGGSYARQPIAWNVAANGAVRNTAAVTFPTATAGWGSVLYFGVWDVVSAGNLLFYGSLPVSSAGSYASVLSGETYLIHAGALQLSMYSTGLTWGPWGASEYNGPTVALNRINGRLEVPLANALLNAVLRNTTYTSPATVYAGMWAGTDFRHVGMGGTGPFGYDGIEEIGVTVSIPSYARQALAFDAPASGVTQNTSAITFGPDSLLWQRTGNKFYFLALYDNVTGGNLLMISGCTGTWSQKLAGSNQDVEYAAGSIVVTFT